MAFRLKSSDDVPLTIELAKTHDNMLSLIGERPLNTGRLNYHAGLMKNGQFRCAIWAVAIHKSSGKRFRFNGHHTAHACLMLSPDEFPVGASIAYHEFEIDSLSRDAPDLFLLFDSHKAVRSVPDSMGIYLPQHNDLHELDRSFAILAMRGVNHYLKGLNREEKDNTKRARLYEAERLGLYLQNDDHRIFAAWLHAWGYTENNWMIKISAIVAEALATYIEHPPAATKFWELTFTGKADVGTVTRKLISRLNEYRSQRPRPTPDTFRNAIRRAWKQYTDEYEAGKGKAKNR